MDFYRHSDLEGKHSFLSPSNYAWIRYSEEQLEEKFFKSRAAQRGTELHAFAHAAIKLGIKQVDTRQTLNAYINDVLGFHMTPEQKLFYSMNCYGTADALGFGRSQTSQGILRIFDLKTGEIPASGDQLLIYGALFCLEYKFPPFEIEYDFRLYQSDDIAVVEVHPGDIAHIMSQIKTFDALLTQLQTENPY